MKLSQRLAAAAALATTAVFSTAAQAQTPAAPKLPVIKLCTGAPNGNYEFSGMKMKERISGYEIQVVNSEGSWDNMLKMKDGQCDAALVQEDAVIQFNRSNSYNPDSVADLYQESLHLVCSKTSGIAKLKDLMGTDKTLALGKAGSGPWVTWQNIVAAEPAYKKVVPTVDTGLKAASKVKQGVVDCMLAVSGLRSGSLNEIDSFYGADTVLVDVRDGDLATHKNMTKRAPLYTKTEVPKGSYKNWAPGGWGGKSVDTVSVMAKVVASPDMDERANVALLRAVELSRPAIMQRVQPK